MQHDPCTVQCPPTSPTEPTTATYLMRCTDQTWLTCSDPCIVAIVQSCCLSSKLYLQVVVKNSHATWMLHLSCSQYTCRILVKVIPHSVALISSSEEGGGGNRISEDQIKSYLENALGDAPKPVWGVPGGWGEYCAGNGSPPCMSWTRPDKKQRLVGSNCCKNSGDAVQMNTKSPLCIAKNLYSFALNAVPCGILCKQARAS